MWRILEIECPKCQNIIETTSICKAKCENCGYQLSCKEGEDNMLNKKVYPVGEELRKLKAAGKALNPRKD